MKDLIIVGRGLAGATLSFQLIAKGIEHRIIDQPSLSSSSKVAAGLVNPIVLKRLKMVEGAEQFMKEIPDFYKNLESLTDCGFYHTTSLQHVFANPGEINLWEEKKDTPFHSKFLKDVLKSTNPHLDTPHGLGLMEGVGWLDTEKYLNAHKKFCAERGIIIEKRELAQKDISLLVKSGYQIILCNGHLLRKWDLLPEAIFTPTRGEVMTIKANGLPQNYILHSSIFTIHLGNAEFKVGATYHWDKLYDQPTDAGLERLKKDLEKVYSGQYLVVSHQAGVRPNTKDRKPILGKMAKNLMTFNGMGSRAALMTPFLASTFIDFLIDQKPIPIQYDVKRFLEK